MTKQTVLGSVDTWIHHFGYVGIFLVFVTEMLGAPFPAETTLTAIGLAVSRGGLDAIPAWFAAVAGNVVGSTIAYALGRWFGEALVAKRLRRLHQSKAWKRTQMEFSKRSVVVVFFGKFVSIVRVLVPFIAGVEKLSSVWFTTVNAASACLWAAWFIAEGKYLGMLMRRGYVVAGIVLGVVALVWWVRRRWTRWRSHRESIPRKP